MLTELAIVETPAGLPPALGDDLAAAVTYARAEKAAATRRAR
jgi:hypothetical protein